MGTHSYWGSSIAPRKTSESVGSFTMAHKNGRSPTTPPPLLCFFHTALSDQPLELGRVGFFAFAAAAAFLAAQYAFMRLDWALRSAGVLVLRLPDGLAVGAAFLFNVALPPPRISARRASISASTCAFWFCSASSASSSILLCSISPLSAEGDGQFLRSMAAPRLIVIQG